MSISRKRYSGDDPRLQRPPYSDHCVQYIVHRHVIRIAQSYHNVHRSAARHGRRVYVVLASDTPRSVDAEMLTHQMRKALLEIAQPRKTKYLPGQCVLHLSMRLLLFSKKCVRLGLMNGCACELVDIIFSRKEELPIDVRTGEDVVCKYMPIALLLRAEGAQWILPHDQLPQDLPPALDRRGLFLLRPHTEHFTFEKMHVKRVGFPVYDASVKIVYGAQGEQYAATVVDLAQPPGMIKDDALFWLACYVMLSRAESLDGLLITRLCERRKLEKGAPQFLRDEVDRLLTLERTSAEALRSYLNHTRVPLPACVLELFSGQDEVPVDLCADAAVGAAQAAETLHSDGTTASPGVSASAAGVSFATLPEGSLLKELRKLIELLFSLYIHPTPLLRTLFRTTRSFHRQGSGDALS